ncbi:integrin [Photobacterium alginatilyticum]|uniref:Integrin n=1 Tax=Photobacterium alginatilyticum TaxID=1775171 RepID=A0ABW9YBN7_9GAMM|nr:integrin [Photobacterium alginatilyticum]NBI51173.1 integrin [Photobacterium alginatilyticum]
MKKGILALLFAVLVGCNGGGESGNIIPAPKSFNLEAIEASAIGVKTFRLTWEASQGATSYQVCLKNTSKPDDCEPLAAPTSATQAEISLDDVLLDDELDFFVIASNTQGKTSSNEKTPGPAAVTAAIGYFKASNSEQFDNFGVSVALSADGATLAVGASREDSGATGIGGEQNDSNAENAGAVYVFIRSNNIWVQQAYIKASNSDADDYFGSELALSADGTILAVGAFGEDSGASGVGGNQADNSAVNSGAVYVFTRTNNTWTQQAYIKASIPDADDNFGIAVSLDADGSTLAVAAVGEDSSGVGLDSDQVDNSAVSSGAVYVYSRTGTTWSHQAYVKASNTEADDRFGSAVSLSADGATLAVGAEREDSSAVGIDGDQSDNSATDSGAVYVFTLSEQAWAQQAYIKASNTEAYDGFGVFSVSLSNDGSMLAATAHGEDSNAVGIDGEQGDNSMTDSGAVYVFARDDGVWSQQAYVKASNTQSRDYFGTAAEISAHGTTLAVAAFGEDSGATGIGGDQTDNSIGYSGAVYVFTLADGAWEQQAYIKSPNPGVRDIFCSDVSLSAEGMTLAVGAHGEGSGATGIGGDQTDNSARSSGAVYLY